MPLSPKPSRIRIVALLVVLLSVHAGCGRLFEDEEVMAEAGVEPGTFVAEAGVLTGGGYERLEGAAVFEQRTRSDGRAFFVIELLATNGAPGDTSLLALARLSDAAPAESTYVVGDVESVGTDFAHVFAAHYRSSVFGDARSESGSLVVTRAGAGLLEGRFELTVYTLEQVGPAHYQRRRVPVHGRFTARRGATTVDPGAIF